MLEWKQNSTKFTFMNFNSSMFNVNFFETQFFNIQFFKVQLFNLKKNWIREITMRNPQTAKGVRAAATIVGVLARWFVTCLAVPTTVRLRVLETGDGQTASQLPTGANGSRIRLARSDNQKKKRQALRMDTFLSSLLGLTPWPRNIRITFVRYACWHA